MPHAIITPTIKQTQLRQVGPEPQSAFFKISLAIVSVMLLAGFYELWLSRTEFANLAYHTVVTNPRVRAELGSNVNVPGVLGWDFGDTAFLVGLIQGKDGQGYVTATMSKNGGHWQFPELRVHNLTEHHIINLSAMPAVVSRDQLHGNARLYLVALGASAQTEVNGVADFLQDEFGIKPEILPAFGPPAEAYDSKRGQWIAEVLVQAMAHQFPDIASDLDARIVGVIDGDIYLRGPKWKYAYNYREGERYAVLPTARLDPGFYKLKPSPAIRYERLQKLAAKNVGSIYFGFRANENLQSVMLYAPDLGTLDEASGKYLLTDVESQSTSRDTEGIPCLSFSSANLNGLPRLQPISACASIYDNSEGTVYQIELARGEFRLRRNDLFRMGPMPLFISRMYFSHFYDKKRRSFGMSTWQNLDDTVWSTDPQSIQTISVNGTEFRRLTPGSGFSPDAKYIAPAYSGNFSRALLTWDHGRWKIQTADGVWHYMGCESNSPVPCLFMDQSNLAGDRVDVVRDSDGDIEKVVQKSAPDLVNAPAHDHVWNVTYLGRTIQTIEDSDGSAARYDYDDDGYLTEVESEGHKIHYDYDAAHRMNRILDNGRELRLMYDNEGRVAEVDLPGNIAYRMRYSGEVVQLDAPGQRYNFEMRSGYYRTEVAPLK